MLVDVAAGLAGGREFVLDAAAVAGAWGVAAAADAATGARASTRSSPCAPRGPDVAMAVPVSWFCLAVEGHNPFSQNRAYIRHEGR